MNKMYSGVQLFENKALFKATTSTKFLHTSKKEIQLNNYRVRRQIPEDHANQYFINIILFADTSMSDHYGNELENYLKLVMAKVSRIFKHFSIGHPIAFGSVNIKKTNENFLDPDKYPMNSIILENFCKWQSTQTINPDMKNLNDSYVALLLTRNIICLSSHGDKNCEGAGHANSGTICNQNLSCGVINDGSFSTELTIAHEVGHLTGKGDCLLAEPKEIFNETEYGHLGEHYSLDKICEFAWGLGFYAAPAFDDNEKDSIIVPDGSPCEDNKICYEGECISSNEMKTINGGWSDYGSFSKCSRTCGGGIKSRHRYCNNPTPMYGGQYCLGKKIDYQICALKKCPQETQDFRDSQCADYKNPKDQDFSVSWKSYENTVNPCLLYCMKNDRYFPLHRNVLDGTPCRGENSHMCVNGICKKYGCDYKFDSVAELDICGVCNGNNSTCHQILL
ncbi:hypothetical protein HCN44_003328 [Aphidius gifuensis]|uniref:ADAMTS/ADAMTS-like cysteine-rich domain-containing protein n=2 Tax=Aphidius gifuensis TaxID=684658 RepID=A0A834XXQ7_APHGI|nr:hypothetical protein HCN44_003328 [Aphidius gifuensis]